MNYTDGSYQDFYQTSCSVVTGCGSRASSNSASHGGRAVASCFAGQTGNCFVNYTDGSYQDFHQSSCGVVSGCAVNPGTPTGVHGGRSVQSCFAGASGNCFVNYSDGSFKDFYQTSCPAVDGCSTSTSNGGGSQAGNSGSTGSGSNNSGNSDSGSSTTTSNTPSATGFSPPLFRRYTASDCSYTISPGESFENALSSARPGEKVCLRQGTYSGRRYVSNIQGAANNFVVLMSYPGEKATIRAGDLYSHGLNILTNVRYFEVYNIDFEGAATGSTTTRVSTSQGFPSGILGGNTGGSVHHIRIVNNRIRNFPGGGVNLYYTTHADIQGNTIYNNARWSENMESGISVFKPHNYGQTQNNWPDANGGQYSVLVRHNIVFNNENRAAVFVDPGDGINRARVSDGNCIVLDSFRETGYSGRSLITQNVCYNNGGNGLHIYQTNNATVRNNTSIYSGKTWWDSSNNGNLGLWGEAGEISNSNESRNNVFENNLTWPHPNNAKSWNLRIDAGPGFVSGSPTERATQSISLMNVTLRNNMFVVSGTQSAAYLPTGNGNRVVNSNPGLVMTPSESVSNRDYRIVSGSQLDRLNIGATFYK